MDVKLSAGTALPMLVVPKRMMSSHRITGSVRMILSSEQGLTRFLTAALLRVCLHSEDQLACQASPRTGRLHKTIVVALLKTGVTHYPASV